MLGNDDKGKETSYTEDLIIERFFSHRAAAAIAIGQPGLL